MSQKKLTGFLLVSAILLTGLLIGQHSFRPQPIWAGTSSRAGNYIVATTAAGVDQDLLWVVDVEIPRLSVYGPDRDGQLAFLTSVNLAQAFEPLTPQLRP